MEHVQAQVRVQAPIKKKSVRQIVNVKSVLPTAGALSMSSFTVDAAMQTMEVLRGEAGNYNVQYVVQGRAAMLALMSRVYAQFHSAKSSSDFEQFMNNVRNKLTTLNVKFRTSTPDTSLIIRYVFADFDDKQVHVYGRSLDVAFAQGKLPSEFSAFVEETKGGFDGLRGSVSAGGAASGSNKIEIALTNIKADTTIDTITLSDWKSNDEDFRVMIAVRNDDGDTADLKDARLTDERQKAALLLYYANQKERENPPKKKATAAEKVVALQAQLDVANAKAELDNLEAELKQQIKEKNDSRCEELRPLIVLAKSHVETFTAAEKLFKLKSKEKVAV